MYISYIFALKCTIFTFDGHGQQFDLSRDKQDLAAENNSVYDGSELPKFSAEFAEVLKENLGIKSKRRNIIPVLNCIP